MNDKSTLEALENDYWGEPEINSHIATQCHKLRKLPLSELSCEDLRLLIGQQIGLVYLLPIAFDKLEINLLESGDCFDGDLLVAISNLKQDFWEEHLDLKYRAIELFQTVNEVMETLIEVQQNLAMIKRA